MELREWLANSSAAPPTRPAAPSTGYPQGGLTPTKPGAYWYYQIEEELRNIILAAGLAPDGANLTQLLTALRYAGVFQTAAIGDNSTKVATTNFFQISAIGGAGQNWQNVSGSRVIRTTYTNTSGRPIQVHAGVTVGGSAQASAMLLIAGTTLYGPSEPVGSLSVISAIVPNGFTYQITDSGGVGTIQSWFELR